MAYKDLEKKKAYDKAYFKANKDKILAQNKAWYEANKNEKKAYYEANKDKIKARKKAYFKANKDKILAQQKEYYEASKDKILARSKAYNEANKDKILAQQKEYYEANSAYYIEKAIFRQNLLNKLQRPSWYNSKLVNKIYNKCHKLNKIAGFIKYHVDHIVPLQGKIVSGLHVQDNLKIILASLNRSKSNKF